MSKTKRKIIAVVTALANSYAEREILNGIIDENRKNGYLTVVFTIIYNTVQKNNDIMYEHKIYDFLRSEDMLRRIPKTRSQIYCLNAKCIL